MGIENIILEDKCVYTIELIHYPLSDESYLTDRICMHFHNNPFGYLYQFGFFCAIYCALLNKLNCMKELKYELNLNNDMDIFNFSIIYCLLKTCLNKYEYEKDH
jgi:hypothetical protein